MVGLAPIIRALVESPVGVKTFGSDLVTDIMEHGGLYSIYRGAEDLPATIYIGNELRTYFSSTTNHQNRAGLTFYASEIYTDTNRTSRPAIQYLLDQFEIERRGDISHLTPRVTLSSLYTGRMRLLIQALLGAGRCISRATYFLMSESSFADAYSVNQACPFDAANPNTDGLIVSPQGVYWWVRISSANIKFRKLKTDDTLQLRSFGLSGTKLLVHELAALVPDTSRPEVVVSISGLVDVIGTREPVAYGWHFNYASPWKASIVTYQTGADAVSANWYRESTLATVSFSFVEEVPTGTLQILEQDVKFNLPSINPLWYDSGYGYCALVPPAVLNSQTSDPNAPLYCFYGRDNVLKVLRYTRAFENVTTGDVSDVGWNPCGCGDSYSYSQFEESKTTTGGYLLEGVDFSVDNISYNREYVNGYQENKPMGSVTNIDYTSAITTTNDCAGNNTTAAVVGLTPPFGYSRVPPGGQTGLYASAYSDTTRWFHSIQNDKQFAAIAVGDAEAVMLSRLSTDKVYGKVRTISAITPGLSGDIIEWQLSEIEVRPPSGSWESLSVSIITKSSTPGFGWSGTYGGGSMEYFPEVESIYSETKLITSREAIDVSGASDVWDGCYGANILDPCVGCSAPLVSMAYSSGGFFTPVPGLPQPIKGYPDTMPMSYLYTRWIGDA